MTTYAERIETLKGREPSHRSGVGAKVREDLKKVEREVRECIKNGYSATAIAKVLAPRGTSPCWETVRRIIIQDFAMKPTRKARADEAKAPVKTQAEIARTQASALPASGVARINAGREYLNLPNRRQAQS